MHLPTSYAILQRTDTGGSFYFVDERVMESWGRDKDYGGEMIETFKYRKELTV
jgi:hypothetical protein